MAPQAETAAAAAVNADARLLLVLSVSSDGSVLCCFTAVKPISGASESDGCSSLCPCGSSSPACVVPAAPPLTPHLRGLHSLPLPQRPGQSASFRPIVVLGQAVQSGMLRCDLQRQQRQHGAEEEGMASDEEALLLLNEIDEIDALPAPHCPPPPPSLLLQCAADDEKKTPPSPRNRSRSDPLSFSSPSCSSPSSPVGELVINIGTATAADTTMSSLTSPSLSAQAATALPASVPGSPGPVSSASLRPAVDTAGEFADSRWELQLLLRLYRELVTRMLAMQQDRDDWIPMEVRRVRLQQRIDGMRRRSASPLQSQHQHRQQQLQYLHSLAFSPPPSDSAFAPGLCVRTFSCPVCLDECPSYTAIALPCSHSICSGCLRNFLSSLILRGETTIRCPCWTTRPCPAVLSSAIISAYTSAAVYSHWQRICTQKRDSSYRSCPRCGHQQKGSRLRSAMRCDSCQFAYCFHHSAAHPPSQSCRSYVRSQAAANKDSLVVIALTTVRCPSCAAPVEKESGCNHLCCSQCQCEFCFLCGSRYLNGLHFWEWNCLTGCPGLQHAPGMAGERRTAGRLLCRSLLGWPITLLLVPTLLLLLLALLATVELLWLAGVLCCLPALLWLGCCCRGRISRWQWRTEERFRFWLCLGPRLLERLCSC